MASASSHFEQVRRDDGTPITVLFHYFDHFAGCEIENAWHRDTEEDVVLTDAERARIKQWIMENRSWSDQAEQGNQPCLSA